MRETAEELRALQSLLDASHAGATGHLRGIINDDRTLTAREIASLLTGMRVVTLATVTARGEPRISALDGHFLHGRWTLGTDPSSAKGRQVVARPAVSAAHVDGEELAVFSHGRADVLTADHPDRAEVIGHWKAHYGASALPWDDVLMFQVVPSWMVGYAFEREKLLRARGVTPDAR